MIKNLVGAFSIRMNNNEKENCITVTKYSNASTHRIESTMNVYAWACEYESRIYKTQYSIEIGDTIMFLLFVCSLVCVYVGSRIAEKRLDSFDFEREKNTPIIFVEISAISI